MSKTYEVDPHPHHWLAEDVRRQEDKPFLTVPDPVYRMHVSRLSFALRDFLRRRADHQRDGIRGKVKVKWLKESWAYIRNFEKFVAQVVKERECQLQ